MKLEGMHEKACLCVAAAGFLFFCLLFVGRPAKAPVIEEESRALEEVQEKAEAEEVSAAPEEEPADTDGAEEEPEGAKEEAPGPIVVHVCGAVEREGVVTLEPGARAYEALAAAGGETEDADLTAVNLAGPLADGQQLYSPRKGEVQTAVQTAGAPAKESGIDLNSAGLQELMTLPGIGEARAKEIIAYREANGGFQSAEELMKISGIGESTFRKLEEQIRVGP